jgi:hypothetical protein
MINKPPFNPDFLAAFRARDEAYARLADIKTIPATDNEVQFKFPDLRPAPWMPKGGAYLIPPRRPDEADEEWVSRCVIIENIGDNVE